LLIAGARLKLEYDWSTEYACHHVVASSAGLLSIAFCSRKLSYWQQFCDDVVFGARQNEFGAVKSTSMDELRILLVDDEKKIRTALLHLLNTRSKRIVVGEASDGPEAILKTQELMSDVVIIDLSMPQMNGLRAAKAIRRVAPGAEVLIFTQHDSPTLVWQARDAGARGYLLKSDTQNLLKAVETIGQHKPFCADIGISSEQV
jgi:CheY-like chemotaxis protein